MKNSPIALLACAFLVLAACPGCDDQMIDTPDGTVPDHYATLAQSLAGSYSGSFKSDFGTNSGRLFIQFLGDRPILTFKDRKGNPQDPIAPDCGSRIGAMKRFGFFNSNTGSGQQIVAYFALDPANCKDQVQGRELDLDFDITTHPIQVGAEIFEDPGSTATGRAPTRISGVFIQDANGQ